MNSTMIEYSIDEKVSLPFVFLPCLLLAFIMYKYAIRRLVDSETFAKRMQYLYSAAAGAMIGQFLFHTLQNGTSTSIENDHIFILLGWYIILFIQKYTRVNNENEYYTSPNLPSFEITHKLDGNDMQMNEYYESSGSNQAEFSRDMFILMDETKELNKRRLLCVIFFVSMVYISIIEGFFLMYHPKTDITTTIAMFYLNKLIQTFVVCVVLLHGMYHTDKGRHWYAIASIVYCLVCLLSSIPALVGQSTVDFLENLAVSKIYLLIIGIIMYIAQYFAWLDRTQTSKKETVISLIIIAVFGASSYATGVFI